MDPTEIEHVMRYRKKVEKDEEYIKSIAGMIGEVEELVKQNNAVDIYEEYFAGSVADHSTEQPYAKTLTVFRDPSPIKRAASYISWSPDPSAAKCAIAYSILGFQEQPEGMSKRSYIWDVNAPNKPDFYLRSPVTAVLRQLQPEGSAHPLRRVVQRSGCVLGHPQGPQPGGFVPD